MQFNKSPDDGSVAAKTSGSPKNFGSSDYLLSISSGLGFVLSHHPSTLGVLTMLLR